MTTRVWQSRYRCGRGRAELSKQAAYHFHMIPHKPGLLLLLTFLYASSAELLCHAQQAQAAAPIRYQFGDDPDGKFGWTNPNFDDSAWPIAPNGLVPSRSTETNRFQWVRIRVQMT